MNRRNELPPHLRRRGFRVIDARRAGVPARRLDASDLDAPLRGVRVPTGGQRRDAVAALLGPGQAFTGPTAAKIWGMPLPRHWHDDERLWVSTWSRNWTMRRDGVVSSRRSDGAVVRHGGYPVLDAVRTWCSLGLLLAGHDLVAVADRLVTASPRSPALAAPEQLLAATARNGRGVRALRAALAESRPGAWSRPESLLRVAVTRARLPEPVLNSDVPVGGERFAAPDLAWPDFMVCAEYDGFWHDDPRRRADDLERHELLADAGWLVTHIRKRDLFPEPLVAVARVLRRLTSRGYHHPGTIERSDGTSWLP
jgi:very-short-patch-repair endonuclease